MRSNLTGLRIGAVVAAVASLAIGVFPQHSVGDETVVVRVPVKGGAAAVTAEAPQARVALDYGSFRWMELDAAGFAHLQASGIEYQLQANAHTLQLGEIEFDPASQPPVLPAAWDGTGAEGAGLRIVQFVGPTRQEWLDRLESQGLEIVQYIHPHTYVVWGEAVATDVLAEVDDTVRWDGSFAPAYKVQPRWRNLAETGVDVKVILYRGADPLAAVEQVEALGGEFNGIRAISDKFEVARFTLPGNQFQAAARIPGVYSVKPVPQDGGSRSEMSNQVNVNNIDGSNLAFPGYEDWLSSVGLDGTGIIMANVDDGVQEDHPDLVNRFLTCTGSTCGGTIQSNHGTHTAGIMAGDASSGTLDSYGFLRGLGMAPEAELIEQVYSPTFQQEDGMLLLMTQSYNNGALLSSNSWGPSGSAHGYDDDTMQVDQGVRDADPDTPGNQPLSYVLSFMNGYGGVSSQGTPDEAKNLFNIGSTKLQTAGGAQDLNIDDLSSNTAHGPALDGRTIPHMVAPGCYVDSSVTGSSHGLMCGTSMASPHVSGAIALFIEYYRGLPTSPPDPSPALIKAAFLPVAKDLAGLHDADGGVLGHPFDSKQGWGRMDVEAVVNPAASVRYFDNPIVFDNTGEVWEITLSPDDPSQPMRIMLVWTDAPGHGLGGSTPAWNNDLDLEVEVGADTYRGNWFGGDGWSVSGGSADGMNNTEGIFLGPTPPASATIRVMASNINSDGIPNEGDATDQDFALVCYNCSEESGFTVDATPESQDICVPDNAIYEITVGQVLGFADPVTLSSSGEPAGASVDFSVNPVTPPGTSTLTIGDTGAASPGTYTITIEGISSIPSRFAEVELRLFDAPPDVVTLTSPGNGDIDVLLLPTFTWTEAAGATEYALEVATDYAFAEVVIEAAGLSDTSYGVETLLDDRTEYYWRVTAGNVCGTGGPSAVYTFTTRDFPEILLVDDDDNDPDVRSYYADALDALGYDYDVWDTDNSDVEPDAVDLAAYSIVIWFTGDEYGGEAGPGAAGETALSTFLAEEGNCLFLSSQDYHYDRGQTTFMSDYLGVASISNEVGHTTVTGEGTVFAGLGPYALSYPFGNFSDEVSPDGSAELAFSGTGGDAAIAKDNGTYRSTFWGFPFEAVPTAAERNELMDVVVRWCRGPLPDSPLPADSLTRNRYVAFRPNNGDVEVAFQVELVSSTYFPGASVTKWVDVPDGVGLARLTDSPVTRVWEDTPVYVGDCAIVPAATYEVRATEDGEKLSDPLVVETTAKPGETAYWCDCVGELNAGEWMAPDGVVNFGDITAAIMGFQVLETAPHFSRIDVDGEVPNNVINFSDINAIVHAFQGQPYPFSNPAGCP